ncbi:MAG TPA: thermonuclease family protein [Candidatus Pacearchaeota archaeon]|nr:thermonuclease family protein [Candidatus Pacearchaeota archaeon]
MEEIIKELSKDNKKYRVLLVMLIFLLLFVNYEFLNDELSKLLTDSEYALVTRVIDGDTLELEDGERVRLLGINTPEKGEAYYNEAKELLENLTLNKTVRVEFGKKKYDLYDRTLAYIFVENTPEQDVFVNVKIVEQGFANLYFPESQKLHYAEFAEAWESCLEKNQNLCEKSLAKCAPCIELKQLNYNSQKVVFENICNFSCDLNDWKIKDEGRKNFIFDDFFLNSNSEVSIIVGNKTDTKDILYWKKETYVWTESGDSLFLRDSAGKLVLWESY